MVRAALSASATWVFLGLASAFRLHFGSIKGLQNSSEAEVPFTATRETLGSVSDVLGQSEVDFSSWMTTDFTYQPRKSSIWGWIKKTLFDGRREFTDLKDELVTGHFCNGVGTRDQTYYASSMCYWLPEIQSDLADRVEGPEGPGLKWVQTLPGQQLCSPFSGAGRCVKCSVCHNNGMSQDGSVDVSAFEEDVISLPSGCLKELAIESICTNEFRGNHTSLVNEKEACEQVQARYEAAVQALNSNLNAQSVQQTLIDVTIPANIRNTELEIARLEGVRNANLNTVWQERVQAQPACYPFRGEYWWSMLTNSYFSVDSVLAAWPDFYCWPPSRPWCDRYATYECQLEWDRYEREYTEYVECATCSAAKDEVQDAADTLRWTEAQIANQQAYLTQLYNDLSSARLELARLQSLEPGLRADLAAAEAEWFPEKERCEGVYEEYENLWRQWMREKVPTFYDVSCEKACLQSSLIDAGCAVMEGVMRGEIWDSGADGPNAGIDVVCSPPSASFVLTPTKYGTAPETEFDMCRRIFDNDGQIPRRPQSIVEQGLLWKRERLWWRWRTRYFVLESGDAVRSAIMRYWDKTPSEQGAQERVDKAIILWDAVSAEAKAGSKYRWKTGEECILLKHFYRDYILCSHTGGAATRDRWLSLIGPEIRFPSR